MQKRTLGSESNALEVSALGLGCMGMTFAYGSSDPKQIQHTLARSFELGVNFLDTSDSYGPYSNELLLAPFVNQHRDDLIIASKFGQEFRPDGSRGINGRPEYVRSACDESLNRLGVDHIDLYYQHRIDPNTPIEETWGALSELVGEGKVRYLGLSEASSDSIRNAHAVHPVTALQTEWSLWSRDVEVNGILETTRELGIGFVPYSPLGRGFLTGKFPTNESIPADDGRKSWPRFQDEALTANAQILESVTSLARKMNSSPAQIALAWLLAQGEDVVPIPGSRKVANLEDNIGSLDVQLSDVDMRELDVAAPIGGTIGQRYPDLQMKSIQQ
ncbi:MAG: aldo/keto reductase [Candidatus Nanopelagicales bacterium]